MAHRGPGIRTPRTRAVDVGTESKGFEGGVDICPQCGHPTTPGTPHAGHYQEQPPAVQDGTPVPSNSPFTVG